MRIVLYSYSLAEAERALILAALAEMGTLEGAAELCGVPWTTFQRLLRAHSIEWPGAPTPARRRPARRQPRPRRPPRR